MIPDTFIPNVDGRTHEEPSRPAKNPSGRIEMETDWEQERLDRDSAVERLLSDRNPDRIRQGIEAYKRDLPRLLRDQKERHVVAYDGGTQVGIANTRERLLIALKQQGLANDKNVFIKIISSLEDNKEDSCSSNYR